MNGARSNHARGQHRGHSACGKEPASRMLKNPPRLSFRGAAGDEESRPDQIGVSRARFLASLGMTTFIKVFQHPARGFTSRLMMETALRRLVVFGAFALLALFVFSHRPYPYAATPAPAQVKTAEPEYLTPVELKFSPDGQRIYVVCEGNDSVLAIFTCCGAGVAA